MSSGLSVAKMVVEHHTEQDDPLWLIQAILQAEDLAKWSGVRPEFETSQNRKVVKMVSSLNQAILYCIIFERNLLFWATNNFVETNSRKNLWAVFCQKLLVDLSFNLLSIKIPFFIQAIL
jgi:hypothetical protein